MPAHHKTQRLLQYFSMRMILLLQVLILILSGINQCSIGRIIQYPHAANDLASSMPYTCAWWIIYSCQTDTRVMWRYEYGREIVSHRHFHHFMAVSAHAQWRNICGFEALALAPAHTHTHTHCFSVAPMKLLTLSMVTAATGTTGQYIGSTTLSAQHYSPQPARP